MAAVRGHPDANYILGQQALGFDPFQDNFDWKGNYKATLGKKLPSHHCSGCPQRNYNEVQKHSFTMKSMHVKCFLVMFSKFSTFLKAQKYLKKATVAGHVDAQALYGIMLLRGLGVKQNKEQGIDLLRRAVLQGSINAAAGLGEYYYRHRHFDGNIFFFQTSFFVQFNEVFDYYMKCKLQCRSWKKRLKVATRGVWQSWGICIKCRRSLTRST